MYQKLKDFQFTIVAIILGFALVLATTFAVCTLNKDGIAVTGSAFKVVKSDTAVLKLELRARNELKSNAYNKIKSQIPTVKEFLIKKGIKDNEITILPASTYNNYKMNPINGYSTNIIESYVFEQTIQVKTNDVDKIQELSVAAQELLDKGIDLNIYSPEYLYSKLGEIKVELLKQASEDAKERAKGMLSATGNKVGKISSVKMGVFQITPVDSTDVSDSGYSDTTAIEKKVTAVANVTFKIK